MSAALVMRGCPRSVAAFSGAHRVGRRSSSAGARRRRGFCCCA